MNPLVQRYLPPLLVFGAALFFGWPPSQPLDLGDDIVRTTSVRWKADDLKDLPPIHVQANPFREVLVAAEEVEDASPDDLVPEAPAGPSPEEIRAGLRLDGFANMAGRRWAVLNGRPRLPGDLVTTTGNHSHQCKIVAVETSHVVVRCEETVTEIRAIPQGTAQRNNNGNKPTPDSAVAPTATPSAAPDPASIATPPDMAQDNNPPPQV